MPAFRHEPALRDELEQPRHNPGFRAGLDGKRYCDGSISCGNGSG
jgi:hypothetical protein